MREIQATAIEQTIRDLCIRANKELPEALCACIRDAQQREQEALPREMMRQIARNIDAAKQMDLPVCQDTGMAIVFADLGQDVHVVGGGFERAVQRGVARGYTEGFLRCSIVADPLLRENTKDNTPAVLHLRLVEGDRLHLTLAPKGFGSENMSQIRMFTPSAEKEDILHFLEEVVIQAGGNPCPPITLGVGIGGNFESCALLAKRALCRDADIQNADAFYAQMEREALERVNALGIGPQGFGGKTTALYVHIEQVPTHIAGLPVAVNVGCHVTRHCTAIL